MYSQLLVDTYFQDDDHSDCVISSKMSELAYLDIKEKQKRRRERS